MLRLCKTVPAHQRAVTFRWISLDFHQMDQKYRQIRARTGRDMMDTCFWCRRAIEDGEMMALAAKERGANVILCRSCALEAGARTEEYEPCA